MVQHHIIPSSEQRARQAQIVDPDQFEGEEFATLGDAREAVDDCRRCPLYKLATQAVFGEGPKGAELMFVGEQPGDQEDLQGRPFVGPAGRLFDAAMKDAGLKRERAYVTNAVKHFKFVPRGKRRLHQRPSAGEIKACRFWLDLEREFVKPKLTIALGATAVQSLVGRATTLRSVRDKVTTLEDGGRMYATVHPSSLLRMPDRDQAAVERERFVKELREVGKIVREAD